MNTPIGSDMTAPRRPARPTLLDRAIGYVSPAAGARRARYRNFIYQLYEAANFSTTRSYLPVMPNDAKFAAPAYSRLTMLSHARYLYANLGWARGLINDLRRYSVGPKGLIPQSDSENDAWGDEAVDCFTDWCKMADASGRFSFGDLQRMAVSIGGVDGDCALIPIAPENPKALPQVHFVEGHQIADDGSAKGCYDGVLVDAYDRVLGYRVLVNQADGSRSAITVDPANFFHFFDPERFTGTRGVTWLAHAINNGRDIFDLLSYEKQFLHNACSTTLLDTTESGSADDAETHLKNGSDGEDKDATDPAKNGTQLDIQVQHLEGGLIRHLKANSGENLEAFQFERPTAAFRDFLDHLEGDGYIGAGLPFNWKNLHKEGGPTLRAAMVRAQRRFDEVEALVAGRLCDPTWSLVISAAARLKLIGPKPKDWNRVTWQGPAKATIDAGRESKANIEDIKMSLRTYQEDYAERGKDARREVRKAAKFQQYLEQQAAKYGVDPEVLQQRFANQQPDTTEEAP